MAFLWCNLILNYKKYPILCPNSIVFSITALSEAYCADASPIIVAMN